MQKKISISCVHCKNNRENLVKGIYGNTCLFGYKSLYDVDLTFPSGHICAHSWFLEINCSPFLTILNYCIKNIFNSFKTTYRLFLTPGMSIFPNLINHGRLINLSVRLALDFPSNQKYIRQLFLDMGQQAECILKTREL